MSGLVNELGFSPFWGRKAEILAEYTEPDAAAHYKRLIAELGAYGTECVRNRDIAGYLTAARVVKAEHSFIFPPQEDATLRGNELDSTSDGRVRLERKEAYMSSTLVEANLGIVFTAEPPRVQVYDLMGNGVLPQVVEHVVIGHS